MYIKFDEKTHTYKAENKKLISVTTYLNQFKKPFDADKIATNYAEKNNLVFNNAVFFAWLVSFIIFFGWSQTQGVFLSFLTLPTWICCGTLFIIFSKIYQKK